ncbi:MAG: ClpXP protease specificity-enhancing factor SspB [Pseudomonadota bacterium]
MTDYIGYEALTQAAMRGVMREALRKIAKDGPVGDHHFYITFRTKAPGVEIADHLVERFPDEMTIVVQHQYWDLEPDDDHFEVILKFAGVPQHLFVPYAAVTRFVDPSVNFGLTFEKDGTADKALPPVAAAKPQAQPQPPEAMSEGGTVVSLEAFRKK